MKSSQPATTSCMNDQLRGVINAATARWRSCSLACAGMWRIRSRRHSWLADVRLALRKDIRRARRLTNALLSELE